MTTIAVKVTLEKVSGKDQTPDYLIDYFAGEIGRENGARKPVRLEFNDDQGDTESVYEVKLVEDA